MLPSGAARMLRKAESAGLKARATLAIGWAIPREGKPLGDAIKSVVLKVKKGDALLIGVWENGKFRRGYRHPGRLGLPDQLGSRELEREVDAL